MLLTKPTGINEVQFKQYRSDGPKFVLNSVAKMNEYYLHNAQYEKRRYTMCHEVRASRVAVLLLFKHL